MNLLEHEVPVAALFCHCRGPCDPLRREGDGFALEVFDPHSLGFQRRHLSVAQEVDALCVFQERGHIRCDKVLSLAEAYRQRGTIARGDDGLGAVRGKYADGEAPAQLECCQAHCLGERMSGQQGFDEMRDDLRVGFGHESVAGPLQAGF